MNLGALMPFTIPATLDAGLDVMLDDVPDVPATLRSLRGSARRCGRGHSANRRCWC